MCSDKRSLEAYIRFEGKIVGKKSFHLQDVEKAAQHAKELRERYFGEYAKDGTCLG